MLQPSSISKGFYVFNQKVAAKMSKQATIGFCVSLSTNGRLPVAR